jgi:uncharacterized protein (TIGR03086 family)
MVTEGKGSRYCLLELSLEVRFHVGLPGGDPQWSLEEDSTATTAQPHLWTSHSFGSMTPRFLTTSNLPPFDCAMYMFIRTWCCPGTISAGPPGPWAMLAWSNAFTTSSCLSEPALASHALNNQLLWGGIVTGQQLVSGEDTMGAVPIEGDLAPIARDVAARAIAMWGTAGVLDAMHATPFGELPGAAVINFATIDAIAHAWDLASSVGRPIEFEPQAVPSIAAVVDVTCTDAARAHGLIKAPTEPPADATDTERLMAAAGRTIRR